MSGRRAWIGVALGALLAAAPAAGPPADAGSEADWPMFNRDPAGTRFAAGETLLGPGNVGRLGVTWRFSTPGAVHGTPAVVDGVVYVGDSAGNFYALEADTGALRWRSGAAAAVSAGAITGSALVTEDQVIFGDEGGVIWGLDRATGLPVWSPLRPNDHAGASIFGSPIPAGDLVVITIASIEEFFTFPNSSGTRVYPCCTFRGSVAGIDPASGRLLWHTHVIFDEDFARGASGAGIWSTATYDAVSGLIFVSTGNNYSEPATVTSDAIIALEAASGRIVWTTQLHPNDVWNFEFPISPEHPDFDFGDSPQVLQLRNGRTAVAAGQKSGFFHLLDARTGKPLDRLQVGPGGELGGLFADSAQADGFAYANGSDWPEASIDPLRPATEVGDGYVVALRSDVPGSLKERWRFVTPESPNLGGVAVANGVVYFHSSRSGTLYALDAGTGAVLTSVEVGIGITGPSVSGGRVFLGTGDQAHFFTDQPGGSVVALGLPDD